MNKFILIFFEYMYEIKLTVKRNIDYSITKCQIFNNFNINSLKINYKIIYTTFYKFDYDELVTSIRY